MRLPKSFRLVAVTATLAIAATACGGTEPTTDPTEPTGTEAPTGTEEPTGEPTDGAMGDDMLAGVTLVTEGTLTVCSEIPYEPFEFEDAEAPSGYSGFDIDLVQAIADHLGVGLTVVNSGFDALTSGAAFAAGTCDFAATAMTITDERDESIDFSDGYYNAAQSLAVPTGSEITDLASMEGRLGVQTGTTGEAYATENAPEGVEIVSFESGADLFLAISSNDIVAILQDLPVNVDRANDTGDITVVETYETDENYGFAFAEEGSEALVEAVNGALEALRADGTYDALFAEYFS